MSVKLSTVSVRENPDHFFAINPLQQECTLQNGDDVLVTADKKPGTITVRVEGEHDSAQEYILPYGEKLGSLLDQIQLNTQSDINSVQLFRKSVKLRQKEMLEASLQSLQASVLTAR